MKQCVGCCSTKPTGPSGDFYKSANTEDGWNRYCKQCCKVNRALERVRKRDRRNKISLRQVYRAQQLGILCDPTITLAKLFKLDRGTCQICHKWVKPRYASMDHTKPLSKGGTHTWANVQLTHLLCNLRKSNKEERMPV